MNVAELKAELRKYDDKAEVWIETRGPDDENGPTTSLDVLGEVKLDAGDCQLVGQEAA